MKKTIRILSLFLIVAFCFVMVTGCNQGSEGAKAPEKKFVSIATGGTTGTYFPIGGALAEIYNTKLEGINASAQSTGASIENIGLINDGKVELALVQNDAAFYAYEGTEIYDTKMSKVRGFATLYNEPLQLVATSSSNIKTVADLKGKRVAVGAPGSVIAANAKQILEVYGLTFDDMKVDYVSFGEASNQLKDGHLDASFTFAGLPTSAIIDITAQHDIYIVPIEEEKIKEITTKYPFFSKTVIPKDTYKVTNTSDIDTITVRAMIITNQDLEEEFVYNLTKAMFENLDVLGRAHSRALDITLDTAMEGMPIPLHPGAEKYFAEKGK